MASACTSAPRPIVNRKSKIRNDKAFTLIELLVVMAIIMLLAGLLVPVLARIRAEGRRTACKSNLSQLAKAVQMYALEHQSSYPAMAARPSLDDSLPSMRDMLRRYLQDPRVLQCPADRQGFYQKEGSSYEWNPVLNGRTQDGALEQIIGPSRTPMMYDYENFHPDNAAGGWGGKNVVMCDGSVVD